MSRTCLRQEELIHTLIYFVNSSCVWCLHSVVLSTCFKDQKKFKVVQGATSLVWIWSGFPLSDLTVTFLIKGPNAPKKEKKNMLKRSPFLFPVCGQCIRGGLVPEARGRGGGFLRHHLRHARGDQHRPRQSTETCRPEEDLQGCKNARLCSVTLHGSF